MGGGLGEIGIKIYLNQSLHTDWSVGHASAGKSGEDAES